MYHNTVLVTKCSSWLIGQKRRSSRNRHRTLDKTSKSVQKLLATSGLKALCLVHKTVARGSCTSCNGNLWSFFVNLGWEIKKVFNKFGAKSGLQKCNQQKSL